MQAAQEMKAGNRDRAHDVEVSSVTEVHHRVGLSQAELPGVSKRTLQDWEQDRREPSDAAKSLLKLDKVTWYLA